MKTRGAARGKGGRGRKLGDTMPEREPDGRGEVVELVETLEAHHETGPLLSGGDVDADWMNAYASGEEAVGGSVATPDQDVVDELARALGVEQPDETEVRTAAEILRERDRFRWHLERDAADEVEGRPHRRRGAV